MKDSLLVCKIAIFLCLVIGGSAAAQEPYSWDSITVKNFQVWYPGHPDSGQMRGELWWYHPPYPYSWPVRYVTLYFQHSGSARFRSFKLNPLLADSLHYELPTTPEDDRFIVVIDASSDYGALDVGHHFLGWLYFDVFDTTTICIDSSAAPMFIDFYGAFWGRFMSTCQRVSNPGDYDGDGSTGQLLDAVTLVYYIFSATESITVPCADGNGDCITNISDVVCLLNYLYLGGAPPLSGCEF